MRGHLSARGDYMDEEMMNDTGFVELVNGMRHGYGNQVNMSPMRSKDSQIRHSGINMSIPQGGGPMNMSHLVRQSARDDLITSM